MRQHAIQVELSRYVPIECTPTREPNQFDPFRIGLEWLALCLGSTARREHSYGIAQLRSEAAVVEWMRQIRAVIAQKSTTRLELMESRGGSVGLGRGDAPPFLCHYQIPRTTLPLFLLSFRGFLQPRGATPRAASPARLWSSTSGSGGTTT